MLEQGTGKSCISNTGVGDKSADDVGVDVGGRAAIFNVALAISSSSRGRDTEGSSAVSSTVGESFAAGSLMMTSESLGVVVTIHSNVILMLGFEALHHLGDVVHALVTIAHGQSGEVGVAARAVPVGEKLGGEGDVDLEVLSNTLQKVAAHHHVVTDFNTKARSNLVFPLSGHNLGVGSSNLNTSEKASLVVHIGNDAAKVLVATDRAVVRALGTGVAIGRPAEGVASELGLSAEQGVFLLNAVPALLILDFRGVPNLVGEVAEVSVGGDELLEGAIFPLPRLAVDHDVVASTEGIAEDSDGLEDNFRVLSASLVAG